jgi:hypothetical protein
MRFDAFVKHFWVKYLWQFCSLFSIIADFLEYQCYYYVLGIACCILCQNCHYFCQLKLYKSIALTPEVLVAIIHHHLSLHAYVPIKTL